MCPQRGTATGGNSYDPGFFVSEFCRNVWTDRAGFWREGFLRSIYPTLYFKEVGVSTK